jgi:hypothetical protein
VWCPDVVDGESHLFGECPFAITLWHKIFNWFGLISVVPCDPFALLQTFYFGNANGKRLKGFLLV